MTIDFTTMRKGTRVRGSAKIEVCPKCGRKGEATHYPSKNGKRITHYTHKGTVISVGGFQMFDVTDWCSVVETEPEASQKREVGS